MSACVVCVLLTWLILVILILSVFSFRFSPFEWWSSRDEKIPFPTVPSKDRYQLDWKEDRIIYNSNTTPAMFHHSSLAHSRIPQILIFTHSTNLLSVDNEDATRYGPNILRNIGMYVKAWNEQSFAEISNDNNTNNNKANDRRNDVEDKPRVWFLDNTECIQALALVEPALIPYFEQETQGAFRGDVCRAAALYLSGGYYMDVDMKAVQPIQLPVTTTFSSALTNEWRFFNSYLAVAPRHPILYNSLQIMLHYYQVQDYLVQHEQDLAEAQPQSQQSLFGSWFRRRRRNHKNLFRTPALDPTASLAQIAAKAFPSWKCPQRLSSNDDSIMMVLPADPKGSPAQPAVCTMTEAGDFGMIGCYALKAAYDYHYRRNPKPNHPQPKESASIRRGVVSTRIEEEDSFDSPIQRGSKPPDQPLKDKDDVVLLYEDNFNDLLERLKWYPDMPFQDEGVGCCCNYVVHDRTHRQVYFFSRMVGAGDLCRSKSDIAWLVTEGRLPSSAGTTTTNSIPFKNKYNSQVEYFHLPKPN